MYYSYPDYYNHFHCIADQCIDTCCAEWQIVIDDESMEKYDSYEGSYRQTLRQNINWEEGVFCHGTNGKCAFLRKDYLCDMYLHMGAESLCDTCRDFPRHTEEYENCREITLSLACPEVAKILMNRTEPVTFISKEDTEDESFEDFDYFLFSTLEDVREKMIQMMQDRTKPISDRISKILQIGSSVQRHYEAGTLIFWDECEAGDCVVAENKYALLKKQFLYLLEEFEIMDPLWADFVGESALLLFEDGEDLFYEHQKSFEAWWKTRDLTPLEIVLEQLIVYFLSIYVLGAVYDENIIGKIDACIGQTTQIYLLLLGRWLKRGELERKDLVDIVYRYSREIEHSDENLDCVDALNWFGR